MKLFDRFRRRSPFAPPRPERPHWIVGDIHGRCDLLAKLLVQIRQAPQFSQGDTIAFVGDYVDRGEESAAVLDHIHGLSKDATPPVILRGNHEEMMLDFLDDPARHGRRWLRNGGLQTLASYGIGGVAETTGGEQLAEAAEKLRARLPEGLQDWLSTLPRRYQSGNLHITHAGADPARPLHDQEAETLTWGHPAFLKRARDDDQWVAYGHIITDRTGSDGQGRIAVDSGGYSTGRLTAAYVAPDGRVDVIQT